MSKGGKFLMKLSVMLHCWGVFRDNLILLTDLINKCKLATIESF